MDANSINKRFISLLSGLVLLLCTEGQSQITYRLVAGNESWPTDMRNTIIGVMDEAVDHYNNHGYFVKSLTVEYNPEVPTADANYSGHIRFGGSISTRTALHEISHTLGVGTASQWWNYLNSDNTWSGAHATARVQLYNGEDVKVGAGGVHFWSTSGPTYGLNYAREDGSTNRIRHVRMVSALRWDMGLVSDSDNDGMPDDWEIFRFDTLNYDGEDDNDGDGVNNLDEYNADTNPISKYEWIKVDDRHGSVNYDNNWGEWPSDPSYKTTVIYSEVTGASATFNFTGTRVRYYGFKRDDLGVADIYIDDVLKTSVDCYAPISEPDVLLYESDVMTYGEHTVKIVVSGNKNSSSSGYEIICDAFEYYEGAVSNSILSTNSGNNPNTLKVFPNPVKDIFTIQFPGGILTDLSIFDINGRLVYEKSFKDKIQISKKEINGSGMLFIELKTEDATYFERIVVP